MKQDSIVPIFLDNADSLKPRISLSSEIKVNDDGTFESNDLYLYCKKNITGDKI